MTKTMILTLTMTLLLLTASFAAAADPSGTRRRTSPLSKSPNSPLSLPDSDPEVETELMQVEKSRSATFYEAIISDKKQMVKMPHDNAKLKREAKVLQWMNQKLSVEERRYFVLLSDENPPQKTFRINGEKKKGLLFPHIEGGTLKALMQTPKTTGPTLTKRQMVDIARDVASAIAVLYRIHAVHQDIKPLRIFLKRNADESFSAMLSGMQTLESDTALGAKAVDVKAFGILLLQMAHGRLMSAEELKVRLDPELIEADNFEQSLPRLIAFLISDCSQTDPKLRPSPEKILEALDAYEAELQEDLVDVPLVEHEPIDDDPVIVKPPTCDEPCPPRKKRRGLQRFLSSCCVLA